MQRVRFLRFAMLLALCAMTIAQAARAESGATLVIPIYEAENAVCLKSLQEAGWTVVSAALEAGAIEPSALGGMDRLALVLGNERSGIPSDWRDRSLHAVAIPQDRNAAEGVDSLNVAAAAAILLWEGRPKRQITSFVS